MPQIWADDSGHLRDLQGCGKKFLIKHDLPCPKEVLVMAHHDDAEN